jgi:hypothetical protein
MPKLFSRYFGGYGDRGRAFMIEKGQADRSLPIGFVHTIRACLKGP